MNFADLEHLADTLSHAALIVCYASSISIDAAVFDKPIINIDFEVQHTASLLKSPTQYYKSLHYGKALKTEGIKLVKSKEELVDSINAYLLDPHLHSQERARLVSEQTVYTDGNSGKRIAEYLLSLIQ
jgi:CDP-glycerol glycerophosphotransferase (TagB/SpsB family)